MPDARSRTRETPVTQGGAAAGGRETVGQWRRSRDAELLRYKREDELGRGQHQQAVRIIISSSMQGIPTRVHRKGQFPCCKGRFLHGRPHGAPPGGSFSKAPRRTALLHSSPFFSVSVPPPPKGQAEAPALPGETHPGERAG